MTGGDAVQIDRQALAASTLVVAHPDDEVLWFASILPWVGRVIIAFRDYDGAPGIGTRRGAALAELPYRDLRCLGLDEAGSLGLADWSDPAPTDSGIALDKAADGGGTARRYAANFATLRRALAHELQSCATIFTHNPWGEYGHEDHVQMFRVVESLRAEMGFALWTSTYCSTRSEALAARYSARDRIRRPIDQDYAQGIADIYKRHGCWTWKSDWRWAGEEHFVALPAEGAAARGGSPVPLAYVGIHG